MDMKIISTNKKLLHDYEVIQSFTAGLVLKGYEVKSIKSGYVTITNAWVKIAPDGVIRLEGIDIPLYKKTSLKQIGHYEPKSPRGLLMTKRERRMLVERTHKTGNVLKVIDIFVSHRGYIKITLGLVARRSKINKKQRLVEQQTDRQAQREIKNIVFR
ncbi:MAG TPA: SsrA-binding protein [Candidatus Absconditabacterales bacterium]|nr:SsrA-binding protein [Candidatus Absconditabacterales bacterium]